jgi:hypothetical protein
MPQSTSPLIEEAPTGWRPHPGFQTEFLRRDEFEALAGGAAGPGKTDLLIVGALENIGHPKYHGLILRRTFPRLQEIIDRCHEIYPWYGGVWSSKLHRFEFPSGAKITLGHCQHEESKRDYHGKEFQYIAFDELTEFTQTQYEFIALSRARSTVPGLKSKIRSATNPGGIGHYWVRQRFVDVATPGRRYIDPKTGLSRIFIPGTVKDNPTLFENDPAYLSRLEGLPEVERMRLLYGIWDAFEGQVFPELSQRVHGCDPFEIPPEWERYCVFDWGYSKPFCVHWYAIDYDDRLYLYREWYGCKKEEEGAEDGADVGLKLQAWEVARGIRLREAGEKIRMRIADPSIWHPRPDSRRQESKGITILEDMQREGMYFVKADNDRMHGKMQVHKRLKLDEEIDTETGEVIAENPMFQAFNSCKGFWRTVPNLAEDPKNPEDVDTDQEDHPYDCLRYMSMARPIRPKKVSRIPAGSFQAERNRLLRARQYAKRHGVSIDVAYSRVR